jgi:2-keto-4-pentenoate hydratase
VLGNTPVPLSAFDARTMSMRMSVNSETVSTGVGAACLGNPLQAARWLADTLCERNIPLRAGDVVLTGALGPMAALQPGDGVTAHLGELGTVATRLTGGVS